MGLQRPDIGLEAPDKTGMQKPAALSPVNHSFSKQQKSRHQPFSACMYVGLIIAVLPGASGVIQPEEKALATCVVCETTPGGFDQSKNDTATCGNFTVVGIKAGEQCIQTAVLDDETGETHITSGRIVKARFPLKRGHHCKEDRCESLEQNHDLWTFSPAIRTVTIKDSESSDEERCYEEEKKINCSDFQFRDGSITRPSKPFAMLHRGCVIQVKEENGKNTTTLSAVNCDGDGSQDWVRTHEHTRQLICRRNNCAQKIFEEMQPKQESETALTEEEKSHKKFIWTLGSGVCLAIFSVIIGLVWLYRRLAANNARKGSAAPLTKTFDPEADSEVTYVPSDSNPTELRIED